MKSASIVIATMKASYDLIDRKILLVIECQNSEMEMGQGFTESYDRAF